MTCIVKGFKTKKDLAAAAKAGEPIQISNPSPFPQGTYEWNGWAADMPIGKVAIVTNHPKRSWFAQITKRPDGTLRVS